jgi:protein disulfide-isomerase A6
LQVIELTNADVFKAHCTGGSDGEAKQLCLLAFLPDILDSKAEGRNNYISVLKKTAEHFKERPYSYFWAVGGAHSALEANVGVGGFGYPALVALSPAKGMCVLSSNLVP